jgi:hypothetical protein
LVISNLWSVTSLLLVDEAGAVQEGIPATRKVPLASPRVVSHQDAVMSAMRSDFTRSPRVMLEDLLRYRALAIARQLALDPVVLVLGLIARFEASRSRSAARLAKAIFGDLARKELNDPAKLLCLT